VALAMRSLTDLSMFESTYVDGSLSRQQLFSGTLWILRGALCRWTARIERNVDCALKTWTASGASLAISLTPQTGLDAGKERAKAGFGADGDRLLECFAKFALHATWLGHVRLS
jgi:hypothetical protein